MEGRPRAKARERAEAQARVDATFRREAEQRAENERLSAAYYAKAAASRRARAAAEREGLLSAAEIDVVAAQAGEKAFRAAVEAIDAEEVVRKYEERQRELRETAVRRNAEALAAAKKADEEAAALERRPRRRKPSPRNAPRGRIRSPSRGRCSARERRKPSGVEV